MIMHSTFKLTAISAALMAIYGLAQAADNEAELRELTQPDSSVSVGVGHLSGDRQQFGKYDGVTDNDTHLILDADVRKRDDTTGTWMTFGARNLGLDSRELNAGYDRQGNWGVSVDYNQIPSNNPLKFMTGVTGIGTTTLQYGTPGASTATAQTGLYPATNEVHLGTKRDTTSLGFYKYLMPDLSLNVTFKNEEKDGTQLWGRGSNPEFAVQPINWTTRQLDAILNYTGKQLQLSGGLSGSWFDNHNSFVDTIGGSTLTAAASGAGHTVLSMPLDNQAYQAYVNGGYNFTKSTRGTFKISYSHATQNDSLDPLANALLAAGGTGSSTVLAGTPSSLNGVVNTKLIDLGITSRPIDKLAVVAKLKYDKKDDKTPEQIFGTGLTNHPYDLKKLSAKLEGTYQLPDGYSLTAGADRDKRERTLPTTLGVYEGTVKMRTETDETTWRLQARRNLSETLNGSLAYLHSKRNGSVWQGPEAEIIAGTLRTVGGYNYTDQSLTTTAFTNPFAWADRARDKWRLVLDWAPTETVTLQFNYETSKDSYDAAKSGLQSGSADLISLDANVAINQDWQLNGWVSQDTTKAHQIGITYDPRTIGSGTSILLDPSTGLAYTGLPGSVGWLCTSANPVGGCQTDLVWDAQLKDTGKTIGIGIQGNATSKLKVGGNLQWTETKSQYPIGSNVPTYYTSSNKSKQGLPDITTTMTRIALFGQYAMEKNADIRLDLIHQRYKSDDWTMMEWNSAGTSLVPFTYMDGTQAIANQSQSSTFVGARYIYKFQ